MMAFSLRAAAALVFFMLAAFAPGPAAGSTQDEARVVFERLSARDAELAALSYTATRSSSAGGKSAEEKWTFRMKAPGSVRIEYFTPVHRFIFITESNTWEYIPAARKALHTDFSAMKESERRETLAAVMAHVAVDGLRVGDSADMLRRVTGITREKDGRCIIEGAAPRFVVTIDEARNCLLRSEIYDTKGDLVLRTETSGWTEAAPGVWFPATIAASCRTKDGFARSRTTLADIRVNDNPGDGLFRFVPPAGVAVAEN